MSGRHKTAEQYREEGRREVLKYVESMLDSQHFTMQDGDPDKAVERVGLVVRELQNQVRDMYRSYSEVVATNQQLRNRLNFWESTFGGLAQALKGVLAGVAEVAKDKPTFRPEFVELVGLKDPERTIKAIKALRAVTGWGLKETHDVVRNLRDSQLPGRGPAVYPVLREKCAPGFQDRQDWHQNALNVLTPHFEVR